MDGDVFADRREAGRRLAPLVEARVTNDPVVLGLPRGGLPVAAEVAAHLGAPLDVLVARKIGAPGHREFGIGAIAEGSDLPVFGPQAERFDPASARVREVVAEEQAELQRRVARYRGDRPLPPVIGRTVVVVDDGLATGITAEAALRSLQDQGADDVVLAVPVGAPDSVDRLSALVPVVTVLTPAGFSAVGLWYRDFGQTTDDEVARILADADAG
ncbi:MAG: phosphoribosyltransferase family protein [Acidimicrobiales bacterium]|nr:phosphoribosyltransferase family protein [Acidimicrobiales bacterium]